MLHRDLRLLAWNLRLKEQPRDGRHAVGGRSARSRAHRELGGGLGRHRVGRDAPEFEV